MFLFCLITLTSASVAFSTDLCVSQDSCRCVTPEKKVIDISSVGSPGFPQFYQVAYQNSCRADALYSYNPCFAFDSHDKHRDPEGDHKPCAKAAACIRTPGGPDGTLPEEYVIGLQSSAKFQSSDNVIYVNYTAPGSKRNLIVKLICGKTDHNMLEMELDKSNCTSEDSDIVLRLTSKCACLDGCSSSISPETTPSGLSVGSKLLIAFFTILLAYFVVGLFWNYCNGSQGAELIPNLQFWNELPTLIMEGVVFTCSCCGRKSTYGEV